MNRCKKIKFKRNKTLIDVESTIKQKSIKKMKIEKKTEMKMFDEYFRTSNKK